MMSNKILNEEQLDKFDNNLKNDNTYELLKNAIQRNGIFDAIFNTENTFKTQDIFNTEIKDNLIVTNQKRSGRCWMFAGLSVISTIVKKNLNIKEIELSESYLMFYDKLEKCNTILEYIIENINENIDSRLFRYILGLSGEHDGGEWHYLVKLIKKYGICPKSVMGETYDSSHSEKMNQIIGTLITKSIYLMKKDHSNIKNLYKIKKNTLNDIYKILSLCIGTPVKNFIFEYEVDKDKENQDKAEKNKNADSDKKDTDKEKKTYKTIKSTPQKFSEEFLLKNLDDYITLCNYPSEKYPFYQTFTNTLNINMIENEKIKFKILNVEIDTMKNAIIKSLQNNTPVWFSCDVTVNSTRSEGYLSSEIINASKILNIDLNYDKTARRELLNTENNHAMVITGVHLDDRNKPVRWKVQNSWGEDNGKKGFFTMSDNWFTDYVYECVIDKSFLDENIIKSYEKEPTILEPWNAII